MSKLDRRREMWSSLCEPRTAVVPVLKLPRPGENTSAEVLPTGFEPVSEAREASILGH
jgi:hypothetical protein